MSIQSPYKKLSMVFYIYIYLTLLIGLRYMVGGDTFYYHEYFNQLSNLNIFDYSSDETYQPFFIWSIKIAKSIYPNFVTYQIIHVLIINSILFWFIGKNSKYIFTTIFFCLLIFYINFTVEILRESLAIMVFIVNYKNLDQKKWFKFVFGVIISSMFHLSALYLLVLPFLQFLRLNYFYVIIVILFAILLTQIQSFLVLLQLIQNIQEKISFYSDYSPSLNTTLLFLFAKFIIPIGFISYAKLYLKLKVRYESLICLLGLIGVGTIFSTLIFVRLSNYLLIFYCLSVSEILIPILRLKKLVFKQLIMYAMIFSSILIMGYASFFWPTGYYIKWVPYMSIFSTEAQNEEIIYRE